MDKAGLGSRTRLGTAAGIPTSTITGLITGERRASERTMQAVAAALRVEVTTIREWATQARGEQEPYAPPAEANQLNRRQRRALDELIRAVVSAQAVDDDESLSQADFGLAARRGDSVGRRARDQQDTDAES
jgi:hypothetical protein